MKVKRSITKKVDESILDCRKTIVNATIELLKSIGAESGQDVTFKNVLFMFQHKENISETIIADRIAWGGSSATSDEPFYIVEMDGGMYRSDAVLSVSNLMRVYQEVLKVVRAY